MSKNQTMKKVAMAVVAANVVASSLITAMPAKSMAAENEGSTAVGNQAEAKLQSGLKSAGLGATIQNRNFIKDPNFTNFDQNIDTGWIYTSTASGPNFNILPLVNNSNIYSIKNGANSKLLGTVNSTTVDGVPAIEVHSKTSTESAPQPLTAVSQKISNLVPGQTYKISVDYRVSSTTLGTDYTATPNAFGFTLSDWQPGTTNTLAGSAITATGYLGYNNSDRNWKNFSYSFVATKDTINFKSVQYPLSSIAGREMVSQFKNISVINTDQTAPTAPAVNEVFTNSTSVSGTTEANATVSVKANGTEIGTAQANSSGAYTVTIPEQAYDTPLQVTAQDIAGNISDATTVNVKQAPIATPTINPLTTKSTTASGTGEAGSTLTFKANGIEYPTTVTSDGTWSVTIPKQAANAVVEATSVLNGVSSAKATATVSYEGPNTPVLDNVTNTSTRVTGTGDPGNTITIKVKPSNISYSGTVDVFGEFSINIDTPDAGATVEAVAQDSTGTISPKATKTVLDVIAPDAPSVNAVKDTDTVISGTGEANCDVAVKLPSGGIIEGRTNSEGAFSITIPKQAIGAHIEVSLTDEAGNKGAATTVTVQADTLANPTVNRVSNQDTKVTGTGVAGATVTVKANNMTYTGTVQTDGTYEVTVPKLAAGTNVAVEQTKAGKTSGSVTTIVQDDRTPAAPVVNPVKDSDTTVTGTGTPGDSIQVTTPDGSHYGAIVADNGTWSVAIPVQEAGAKIDATATASNGNTSPKTDITIAQTPQSGTLTTKDFTIGKDQYIVGNFTGDVKNFRVTIGSNVYVGGSIDKVKGTYTFYALDKATKEGTFKIEALDKYGNVLQTKTANIVKASSDNTPGVGTVSANPFVIGQDKNITGTVTGAVASVELVYNGVTYKGGSVANGQFNFYALDKITDKTKAAVINAYDAKGNKIATSNVALSNKGDNDNTPGTGTVSAKAFVIHQDKNVTGTFTGDVKSIKLVYNGVTYSGGTVANGNFSFYALDKITDKSKAARIDGYDAKGNKIATSAIALSDSQDSTSGVGTGTVTANDFNVGTDTNITGAFTGDVTSIKVRVDGTVYSGGTLANGNFTFYAKDKINNTNQVVFVDGYDRNGNKIATSAVTVAKVLPVTAGTITPNMFTVATDKYLTASYTGDVKSVTVTINGTKYTGGTVSNGQVNFYIGNKITAADTVTIEALDAYGRSLQVKNVPVQQTAPETTGTVTPDTFTTPGDKYLTGSYTGIVKSVIVTINGTEYQGGTVEDGKINFWIGDKISKTSDVVTIKGLDKDGNILDTKTVNIAAAKPEVGTITPANFSFKTSAIKGTYTGNAKSLRVTVNGVALPVGGTVANGNFNYYVGLQDKVSSKSDTVKIALLDKNGLVMDEQNVTIID
ncbi:immunoglobulin-like domain-containing protein [Listeria booriae]|uniref:immunoglobulin-like domain-containing protein n=1 Tax=Listeria booriae TaxID=1552123 RepID=UPI00164E9510|nr:immunoglobulin-like domain-containing protein [Listeria booriae]MBC6298617.1 hypothetical protein [Listeria booriae]